MTTGSTSIDGRFNTNAKWGSTSLQKQVGRKISKTWSGLDGKKQAPDGHVRPRVKSRKVIAKLAPQPYSMTLEDETRGLYRVTLNADGASASGLNVGDTCDITCSGHVGSYPSVPAAEKFKLLSKIREKAFGSGFSPWVFTSQAGMAFEMIGGAATSLRTALYGVKRRNWRLIVQALKPVSPAHAKKVASSKKSISARWLELQYGWLPLLSDLQEGAEYVAEAVGGFKQPGKNLKSRRSFGGMLVKKWNFSDPLMTYTTTTYIWKLQAVVEWEDRFAASRYLPSLYDLAEVVWENVPYSFVADWVVPVGDYLAACKTARDIGGKLIYTQTCVAVSTNPAPNPLKCTGPGVPIFLDNHYMTVESTREIYPNLGSFIPPPLEFDVGGLASWRRAANAVALLAGMSSKNHGHIQW